MAPRSWLSLPSPSRDHLQRSRNKDSCQHFPLLIWTSLSCCLLLSALIAGKGIGAVLMGEKPKQQGVPQLAQSLWEGSARSPCLLEGNVPATQTPEVSCQAKEPGGIPTCWPFL